MIGILVIIAASWAILFFIEKQHITALGFSPPGRRIQQFFVGFMVTALCCVSVQYLEAYLKSSEWIWNENMTGKNIFNSIWWDMKSVLTEELIFRGAILYILIKRLGSQRAILISAIAFGIYHWFSYGVLGNVMAMIFVFIGTGLMGYAWAWAFAKTKSILLPFGLHLGWNVLYNTVFSKGPLGESILIQQGGNELTGWASLLNFLTGLVIVPLIVLVYVHYFVKDNQ